MCCKKIIASSVRFFGLTLVWRKMLRTTDYRSYYNKNQVLKTQADIKFYINGSKTKVIDQLYRKITVLNLLKQKMYIKREKLVE